MSDSVQHPAHYQGVPGIECIDVARHFSFSLGNCIKYIWRAGLKPGSSKLEDLRKARFYIDDAIAQAEKEQ